MNEVFQLLKKVLYTLPGLNLLGFTFDFVLKCSTSQVAVGTVFSQHLGAGLQPFQYFSHESNPTQVKYFVHDCKLLLVLLKC